MYIFNRNSRFLKILLTLNMFIKEIHSIKLKSREKPNCRFLLSSTLCKSFKQFKCLSYFKLQFKSYFKCGINQRICGSISIYKQMTRFNYKSTIVVVFHFIMSCSIIKSLQFQNRNRNIYLSNCIRILATTFT